MAREVGDRIIKLGDYAPAALTAVANLLDGLGAGREVQVSGPYGDNGGASTPADEQGALLYGLAGKLRDAAREASPEAVAEEVANEAARTGAPSPQSPEEGWTAGGVQP